MEEEFENNDSIINNFQQDMQNSQSNFKQESNQDMEEENEFDDDTFHYTANIREIAKKDFSKYITKELTPNNLNKNNITNNLNFKYENININEDISGISLLKELEEQWNNIEKQKNKNNNKIIDESTYSNSKSNNNIDKFKYVVDMIEIKKNKFISSREKAKKERNDDHEIEQYFLMKLKEMDKYKITDENLQKKIEIRQQEKNDEENINEQNNVNNYENDNNNGYIENNNDYINYNDNNNEFNFSNEDTFNKKQYLQKIENQNKSPELEDLVYETPARTKNNFDKNILSFEQNNYENENEDNVNIGNISRPEKSAISEKLFGKIKNLYQELNYEENKGMKLLDNNNNDNKTNSYESGVLGINNINLNGNKYEENIILKNIRNNNNDNDIGNINDANKSINFNFNYSNIKNQRTPNLNLQKYENNKYSQKTEITYTPNNNLTKIKENLNIFKDKDRMTLSGLQENFDDILQKVKSHNDKNNKKNLNINIFNDRFNKENTDEKEDIDKYFEELTKEAKSNIQKNRGISDLNLKNNNKKENKILKKIEENSMMINNYMDEINQNRNKFKQRIFDLNNNLNNNLNNLRRKEDINNSFQENKYFGFQNINKINSYKRNKSGYNIFSNNDY